MHTDTSLQPKAVQHQSTHNWHSREASGHRCHCSSSLVVGCWLLVVESGQGQAQPTTACQWHSCELQQQGVHVMNSPSFIALPSLTHISLSLSLSLSLSVVRFALMTTASVGEDDFAYHLSSEIPVPLVIRVLEVVLVDENGKTTRLAGKYVLATTNCLSTQYALHADLMVMVVMVAFIGMTYNHKT
jgi:hypothetical protein